MKFLLILFFLFSFFSIMGSTKTMNSSKNIDWEFCMLDDVLPDGWQLIPGDNKTEGTLFSRENPQRFFPKGDERAAFLSGRGGLNLLGVEEIFMVNYALWNGTYIYNKTPAYESISLMAFTYSTKQEAKKARKTLIRNGSVSDKVSMYLNDRFIIVVTIDTKQKEAIEAVKQYFERESLEPALTE